MSTHLDAPGMAHIADVIPPALAEVGLYRPTPAQARADLRRWSAGRKEIEQMGARREWKRVAVDLVLAELERYEEANRGMVVTELGAWER